jgi:hypothetical protein
MMRRIFAIATDSAGCFHYRLHLPLTHLDASRFEVIWRAPDLAELRDGDIVIGQRLADDNAAWREIGAMAGVLAVYDWDDDLLNVDPDNTVPYSLYGQRQVRDNIRANIAAANVVTCSTPNLADFTRGINSNVAVLPNCIDRVRGLPNPDHHKGRPVRIGWAGSPFHTQDWTDADRNALRVVRDRYGPVVEIATVGADYTGGVSQRHSGFGNLESYLDSLDFCIGLAPLANTPFNGRKSWIKALEYMSRGVIPVVPAIGQYPELIRNGFNGVTYSPYDAGGMLLALDTLLGMDYYRVELGDAALETAARWTIAENVHRWEFVYDGEWGQ